MRHRGLWKLAPAFLLALAWVVFPAARITHAATSYTVTTIPYNWEEISGTGTRVTALDNADDSGAGPFNIGFSFPYFGNTYSQFYADSNGYITFSVDPPLETTYEPDPIPNGESNRIGGWWTDLEGCDDGNEGIYYQTIPAAGGVPQHLVVEYHNYEYYACDTGDAVTFEIKLFPDGTIQVHYNSVANAGTDNNTGSDNREYNIAIGVEDATGTNGTSYCFQTYTNSTPGIQTTKSTGKGTAAKSQATPVGNCGTPYHTAIQFSGYVPSSRQYAVVSPINSTQQYSVVLALNQPSPGHFSGQLGMIHNNWTRATLLSGCGVFSSSNPNGTTSTPGFCRLIINSVSIGGCTTSSSKGTTETVTGTYYLPFSYMPYDITFVMTADSGGLYTNGTVEASSSTGEFDTGVIHANVQISC